LAGDAGRRREVLRRSYALPLSVGDDLGPSRRVAVDQETLAPMHMREKRRRVTLCGMNRRKRWMPTGMLRELVNQGLTLHELSEANKEWGDRTFGEGEGWPPTRDTVSKKLKALGYAPRQGSRRDLIPWTDIQHEHLNSRYLNMLRAMSRSREDEYILTETDQKWIDLLEDLLHGRGAEMVIGYNREIGWYLTDRLPTDEDIIRRPDCS